MQPNSSLRPLLIIDARMIQEVMHGIARYTSHLAEGLAHLHQKNELNYRVAFLSQNWEAPQPFETIQAESAFLSLLEQIEIPLLLRKYGASLYHSPSFSSFLYCPCPTIITIHDLNHLVYGSLEKKIYYQTVLKRFAKKAEKVVTISEFSRKEISRWLKVPEDQIPIVPNAVTTPKFCNHEDEKRKCEKLNLTPGQFFLCLGNGKKHKNGETLLAGYQIYESDCRRKNIQPWPLLLSEFPESMSKIENEISSNVRCLSNRDEKSVSVLLSSCGGLFSPSAYEGFGLPPVEAVMRGTAVAVSDIPPHREALSTLESNEVEWVKPFEPSGWAQAFSRFSQGQGPFPEKKSIESLKKSYSQEQLAEKMDQIYQSVLTKPLRSKNS